MTAPVSTSADLRTVTDAIMDGFAQIPDDGWARAGHGDASGFAAMGIVEGAAHAWDVLRAHDISFRIDDGICERVLNRLFPGAGRTDDPWQDFLTATGRTEATRDQRWTWDSSVRDNYGD